MVHEISLDNFNDIIDIFIDSFTSLKVIHTRILSIIIYVLLRICKVKYEKTNEIQTTLDNPPPSTSVAKSREPERHNPLTCIFPFRSVNLRSDIRHLSEIGLINRK